MTAEPPQFLLEMLTRWDFGWRLSQTKGLALLPVPVDFHTTVEAIHYVKRLSAPHGSTLLVKIVPTDRPGPERIVEIRQRPVRATEMAM
ncbi:hypothetical protein AYO49_04380 [Verrucomicrobiaceae bacterium SCGC AG-212-N21]|nr:hypothetical protein AYO49_04380 [Verrucomicrobiaceae bacterium SCGC AG-212-N21]